MKWLSRVAPVQIAVAWLVSAYLAFCTRTARWTFVNDEEFRAMAATGQGLLVCFWHKTISLSVVSGRLIGNKPRHAMISLSSDGELIARIVDRLGYPAVRGSRGKEGKEDKGGSGAFRQSLRYLRNGDVVAITPDGPRGPVEVMPPGTPTLGRTARVPTFMFGFACAPAIRPRTWDEMFIPLPFGRACLVIEGPIAPLTEGGEAEIADEALVWQERLRSAQRRAEAIVAGN